MWANAPMLQVQKVFKLINEVILTDALTIARDQVDGGAQVIDINMDEAMMDSKAAMVKFLNLVCCRT